MGIYLIGSDEGRNGKSLLARCYASYLMLIGQNPAIIDLDAAGDGVARYFPDRTRIVDLGRTQGQMALFDLILAEPGQVHLLDLPSRYLRLFFSIAAKIGFVEAAGKAGLPLVIFYILDRSVASLSAAQQIAQTAGASRFIAVRNQFAGPLLSDDRVAALYRELNADDEIVMPEIDQKAMPLIERPDFSFIDFHHGVAGELPEHVARQLHGFWSALVRQFRQLQFSLDMAKLTL